MGTSAARQAAYPHAGRKRRGPAALSPQGCHAGQPLAMMLARGSLLDGTTMPVSVSRNSARACHIGHACAYLTPVTTTGHAPQPGSPVARQQPWMWRPWATLQCSAQPPETQHPQAMPGAVGTVLGGTRVGNIQGTIAHLPPRRIEIHHRRQRLHRVSRHALVRARVLCDDEVIQQRSCRSRKKSVQSCAGAHLCMNARLDAPPHRPPYMNRHDPTAATACRHRDLPRDESE